MCWRASSSATLEHTDRNNLNQRWLYATRNKAKTKRFRNANRGLFAKLGQKPITDPIRAEVVYAGTAEALAIKYHNSAKPCHSKARLFS
jgi:hypothetical protein